MTTSPNTPLLVAYVCNILILVPVCWSMFAGRGVAAVFEGTVSESAGLRLLVGSLWLAILAASVTGLAYPRFFAPVLLIQVFYKATWLAAFVLPTAVAGGAVPMGISICFAGIVVAYPILFWFGFVRG
jgi:hypothetical protein